jgi:membrane protein YqaA with SNARE-associated domain
MRSFSHWIIALFASPAGVVILGALDSTLFFSLPLGIDAAVVILAARMRDMWWIVPLLATMGSVAGAALTFWMGVVIGEKGLDRYVPPKRLKRVRAKIKDSGAVALAVLDLIPPPFPFTPFMLAAGALDVSASLFFTTLAACRLLRFGLEAALARTYGRRVLAILDSDLFHDIVVVFMMIALVLTVVSTVRLLRSSTPPGAAPPHKNPHSKAPWAGTG